MDEVAKLTKFCYLIYNTLDKTSKTAPSTTIVPFGIIFDKDNLEV